MSEQLKPCPFCESQSFGWIGSKDNVCCSACGSQSRYWNNRPIEDELRARIAEPEADKRRLDWMEEFTRKGDFDVTIHHGSGIAFNGRTWADRQDFHNGARLRENIDAAMEGK